MKNYLLKKSCPLRNFLIFFLIFFIPSLGGCLRTMAYLGFDKDIIDTSYIAADKLLIQITPPIMPDDIILTASFVNIDNTGNSSTFGRTIAEMIGSRLTQHGFKVIEIKMSKSIIVREAAGEFVVTRDIDRLNTEHKANVIFTGTYYVAKHYVSVSARVIRIADQVIMAMYDYQIPLGANTKTMLGFQNNSW